MTPLREKQDISIDLIFNKKSNEKEIKSLKNEILSEEDKKVEFLLENNLLTQIAKLEEVSFDLNQNHKKEYYSKLYKSIIDSPESTLREYLKNDLELPDMFLAIYFLVEMQERKSNGYLDITKVFTSFFDRVKKGLDNDPVEKYKFTKINDKKFVNFLFDVWYESNLKHLNDIENNVINKRKFWFFKLNKSAKQISRDLEWFKENQKQLHMNQVRNFLKVPLKNDFFLKNIEMEKILKIKELLKKHEKVQDVFKSYEKGEKLTSWSYEAQIIDRKDCENINKILEEKIKEFYQKNHDELVEDIKATKNEQYLKKVITRKLIKGVDDNLINNLPKDSLMLVTNIKDISEQLYQKELTEETKEIIEFLWREKLPEVIQKYLNIDHNYRESLKNVQGKSAKELMTESLLVIKESLEYIEKDINEENLKNLSIHTRYIKNAFKK